MSVFCSFRWVLATGYLPGWRKQGTELLPRDACCSQVMRYQYHLVKPLILRWLVYDDDGLAHLRFLIGFDQLLIMGAS